jgi:REP element-mobilizing transposase RayT
MRLFHKDPDFAAFEQVLAEGLERYAVELYTYCLMGNHWHLVLSPLEPGAMGRLMGWVGVTHVRRHHEHYHTRGGGHLYYGRFKSFLIEHGNETGMQLDYPFFAVEFQTLTAAAASLEHPGAMVCVGHLCGTFGDIGLSIVKQAQGPARGVWKSSGNAWLQWAPKALHFVAKRCIGGIDSGRDSLLPFRSAFRRFVGRSRQTRNAPGGPAYRVINVGRCCGSSSGGATPQTIPASRPTT